MPGKYGEIGTVSREKSATDIPAVLRTVLATPVVYSVPNQIWCVRRTVRALIQSGTGRTSAKYRKLEPYRTPYRANMVRSTVRVLIRYHTGRTTADYRVACRTVLRTKPVWYGPYAVRLQIFNPVG